MHSAIIIEGFGAFQSAVEALKVYFLAANIRYTSPKWHLNSSLI